MLQENHGYHKLKIQILMTEHGFFIQNFCLEWNSKMQDLAKDAHRAEEEQILQQDKMGNVNAKSVTCDKFPF